MENEPDAKRMAAAVAAAAAAAAANAGDPYGAMRSPGMPGSRPMVNLPPSMMNVGPVSSEDIMVPDKMVGLSMLTIVQFVCVLVLMYSHYSYRPWGRTNITSSGGIRSQDPDGC